MRSLANLAPRSIEELAEIVRGTERLPVPLLETGDGLSFAELRGEIRHDVADGVVSCLAGTSLRELNETLARDDRCIPHSSVWPDSADEMPLAVLVLLGLPHAAEAERGTWRDWILGATMVTAGGTVVNALYRARRPGVVLIGHPSGVSVIEAAAHDEDRRCVVDSVRLGRTVRPIMRGEVYVRRAEVERLVATIDVADRTRSTVPASAEPSA